MCPKLIELLSWNGPTVRVCCFMLARASTKTFVSRVQKTTEEIFFVSRVAKVSLYMYEILYLFIHSKYVINVFVYYGSRQ